VPPIDSKNLELEISKSNQDVSVSDVSALGGENKDGAPNRRAFEINCHFPKTTEKFEFLGNQVSTTKYTCLTFLPKNLFE
jgi:hypothetical protein